MAQYDSVAEFERGLHAGYTAELCKDNPLPSSLGHTPKVWSPEAIAREGEDFAKGFAAGTAEYHADKTREVRD